MKRAGNVLFGDYSSRHPGDLQRSVSSSPLCKWLSAYCNFGVNLREKERIVQWILIIRGQNVYSLSTFPFSLKFHFLLVSTRASKKSQRLNTWLLNFFFLKIVSLRVSLKTSFLMIFTFWFFKLSSISDWIEWICGNVVILNYSNEREDLEHRAFLFKAKRLAGAPLSEEREATTVISSLRFNQNCNLWLWWTNTKKMFTAVLRILEKN